MEPLPPNNSQFDPLPNIDPLPIEPFIYSCKHKVLVLKNTEKYTNITQLNKSYTCVDCGKKFTVQPTMKMKIFPLKF